ncbi:TVP38/TMEM64 family protein [Companilactobacillus ginsenosidimutans]|uniref:TVP38/TMEM64 family membrane protein n=1 Tax=Companilactobacillus ginsenosidimutans TaxID=1007676 RepID=A0A0H4QEE9_9LACO|nr:VTT domain-containing protein [Companilactobacillus ginsenosidimutans]AKP66312.1 hypothetical protein ABM34_01260 [Companilactobacillus ginsenosidimutans]
MTKSKKLRIIIGIILAILVLIICVREFKTIRSAMTAFNRLDFLNELREQTPTDAILLTIVLAGFSIIPGVPVSVVEILTGVVFGGIIGSIINSVGIVLGNLIAQRIFTYLHEKVDAKNTPRIVKMIRRIKYPMLGVIIGYMIPMIPTSVISLTATDMKLKKHELLTATILGSIPMAIIYSYGGNALIESHFTILALLVIVIAVMLAIVYFVTKKISD